MKLEGSALPEAVDDEGQTAGLGLPARELPYPRSISAEARAVLAKAYEQRASSSRPSVNDPEAWERHVETVEAPLLPMLEPLLAAPGATLEERAVGGATLYVATPDERQADAPPVQYMIHGGGWVLFGGKFTAAVTKLTAMRTGGIVYGIDYRMPPKHPYPAALDDCLAGYRDVLGSFDARQVFVAGGSAGGNLAAALMLRLREERLAFPRALFLDTPAVDLTAASDTLYTNQGVDSVIGIEDLDGGRLYAGGVDLAHPNLSPLNGDLTGFPPTYLRSGTRDLLLSDTVRMHAKLRASGVDADLYVGEAMPHGGFDGLHASTPEDQAARADLKRWLVRQFA